MFVVEKIGEDIWVASVKEKVVGPGEGDYISEYHEVEEYEYCNEDDYEEEELGLPTDLGVTDEE